MLSLRRNIYVLMIIVFCFFLALTLLIGFNESAVKPFDLKILIKVQNIFSFLPIQVPIIISDFGYEIYMLPQLFILGILMPKFKRWKEYIGYFLLTEGTYLAVLIIKEIIQRQRPDEVYHKIVKTSYSFPSGHSSVNMFFYLALAFILCEFIKNKKIKYLIYLLCIGWVLCVGLSRVILGVHYPSDVIGGYLVGIFVFLLFVLYKDIICRNNETGSN